DRPVLDEVADPVVGAHGDVRTVAGLIGGDEVRLQLVAGDDLDDDLDAVLLAPGLRGGLQRRGLLLVGPDDQPSGRGAAAGAAAAGGVGGGTGLGGRVRTAARGQHGGARSEAAEGEEALSTNLHVFSFESRSSRDPMAALDAATLGRETECVQEYARTCRYRFGHGRRRARP